MKRFFTIEIFCINCRKTSNLNFEKGTDLSEVGVGSDCSIKVYLPNAGWKFAKCPKCSSLDVRKKIPLNP